MDVARFRVTLVWPTNMYDTIGPPGSNHSAVLHDIMLDDDPEQVKAPSQCPSVFMGSST